MVPPVENANARANSVPWKALAAIRNAMRGVGFMFSELSIRILAAGTLATLAAGAYFSISALEWCAALLALSLIWAAEGMNTALERLTDLVSPGFHPLAGMAKDIAAGAVLLASVAAVVIGVIIFGPRFV
ncbi:MAG: diacylglycerol kinase family protein [Betaproteobacteria bacterium]|nr:MAG: diacylglycerol kinase family protein [Betaproteobacteria bacterium]